MNKVAISGRTTGVEDGDGEALLLSQQRGVTLQSQFQLAGFRFNYEAANEIMFPSLLKNVATKKKVREY